MGAAGRASFTTRLLRAGQAVARMRGWCFGAVLGLTLSLGLGVAAPFAQAAAAKPAPVVRPAQPPEGPTLARIRETGVIVLGYRPASAPFSYLDAQLRPTGYSVELCERVIASLRTRLKLPDLEVRRVAVGSATRMPRGP